MVGDGASLGAGPRRLKAACLVVTLLLAIGGLTACGDDDDGGAGGGQEAEPATLRVGVIPIADVAPLYLGRKKGFFEEERLTIEPQPAQGGAAIVPAVVSGDFQIGFSNTVSLLIAASQNLPLQIVSQGVLAAENDRQAWAELLVLADGRIDSPKDLEGRTIAVNTLNNICEVTIKASLEKEGVDVDTLEFAEIAFPEMSSALERGRVAAACAVEPFVTTATAGEAEGLLPFYVRTAPNLTVATYFANREYVESNRDVVDRFVRAMNRSLAYAQEHPDEVREVLLEYTRIPEDVVDEITLPVWRPDLNRPTIELLSQLSRKYGLIEQEPNLDELILQE